MQKILFIVILFLCHMRVAANPYLPILSASVAPTVPALGSFRWFAMSDNVYSDGTITPGAITGLTPLAEAAHGRILDAKNGGTIVFPAFSNNVVNGFPAITWKGFNTIYHSTNENYTVDGYTFAMVMRMIPGTGKTYNDVQVYGLGQSTADGAVYYTLLGTTNSKWTFRATVSCFAYVTNVVNEWQLITCRVDAATGIPEIKDNVNTIIGATSTFANQGYTSWGLTAGAETNQIAEFIVYTNRLSDADLLQTRQYLKNKYNLTAATP